MARPSRIELMHRFFPELGQTGSKGDTSAAIEINTRACEAILADQIRIFDEFYREQGPGALCLKLADGDKRSHYATTGDFSADLMHAEGQGDTAMASALREVVKTIRGCDFSERILVLLSDNSCFSLLPVPREYPASAIKTLQEESTW